MRTISMLACLFLIIYGMFKSFTGVDAGVVMVILGSLSFIIIVWPTRRIDHITKRLSNPMIANDLYEHSNY